MSSCPTGGCTIPLASRAEKRTAYEKDGQKALDTWQGLRDDLFRIGQDYFSSAYSLPQIEGLLHDAWDELIHAALLHPPHSAELDRLVTLVLEVRELGPLEGAVMSGGQRLWTDVPFLADDVYAFWTQESGALTGARRATLAAFTAKLCGAGVCAPGLARCALWLFARALEGEMPPGGDVADVLPACREWFRFAKTTLVSMCRDNYCPPAEPPAEDGSGSVSGSVSEAVAGPLVTEAGIPPQGFGVARWLFWRTRVGGFYADGSGDVARLGRACFEDMISAGMFVGVDIPGERVYLERLFGALEGELKAGRFTGCVGAEDIAIDVRWAEEA